MKTLLILAIPVLLAIAIFHVNSPEARAKRAARIAAWEASPMHQAELCYKVPSACESH